MAGRNTFRLNRRGGAQVLKSADVAAAVNAAARAVADKVRTNLADEGDVEVTVDEYTTDRRAAGVTIRSSRGLEFQATRGAITRAAAAVGLEVKTR
ncbi:hypothetical protein SEA_HIBISCUS_10 [Gordonia phage Hibiscus]|uniref:Head-to-tail connector protein n=1 Tax=Gordonia phage Jojo24 TaxID=2859476 RepID=A0AAE7SSK9_9CAUD|nr:hypothetical protein QLQ78_gp10 [Gordonia phage Jojo24]QXO13107.1 hypothetical protein SEA_JOJO24_10 [Gordonia phage Jojo24]